MEVDTLCVMQILLSCFLIELYEILYQKLSSNPYVMTKFLNGYSYYIVICTIVKII